MLEVLLTDIKNKDQASELLAALHSRFSGLSTNIDVK